MGIFEQFVSLLRNEDFRNAVTIALIVAVATLYTKIERLNDQMYEKIDKVSRRMEDMYFTTSQMREQGDHLQKSVTNAFSLINDINRTLIEVESDYKGLKENYHDMRNRLFVVEKVFFKYDNKFHKK